MSCSIHQLENQTCLPIKPGVGFICYWETPMFEKNDGFPIIFQELQLLRIHFIHLFPLHQTLKKHGLTWLFLDTLQTNIYIYIFIYIFIYIYLYI